MRGDYSSEADDEHFERIKAMQDKMINLLAREHTYKECIKSKTLSHENKYPARISCDEVKDEIDKLREEMRQQ